MAVYPERIDLNGIWQAEYKGHFEQIKVPFSREPVGKTICQKKFSLVSKKSYELIKLCFDGVVNRADVYLNENYLGTHWGYTPFWYDVTSLIKQKEENELRVDISDEVSDSTVPFKESCWTIRNGGIIRDVYLIASPGPLIQNVFFQSKLKNNYQDAKVKLQIEVFGKEKQEVKIEGFLKDGDKKIAHFSFPGIKCIKLEENLDLVIPRKRGEITFEFEVKNVKLWSPQNPKLYQLEICLNGKRGKDFRKIKVGFREFKIKGKDFYLNGGKIFLKGVSRHDMYHGPYFLFDEALVYADFKDIKAMGANYVRLVHYPPHPRVPEIANEIGLLISEEVPAWAHFNDSSIFSKAFSTSLGMLWELIERDYNHPAIVMWFTGNTGEKGSSSGLIRYNQLAVKLAKSLDPNRIISYVNDNDLYKKEDVKEDLDLIRETGLQVYCKNAYWDLGKLDEWAKNIPLDMPTLIAEWSPGVGSDRGDLPKEFSETSQSNQIKKHYANLSKYFPGSSSNHIAGICYWSWLDTPWPGVQRFIPYLKDNFATGILYLDREKKKAYWTLRELYKRNEAVDLPR